MRHAIDQNCVAWSGSDFGWISVGCVLSPPQLKYDILADSRFECRSRGNSRDPRSSASMRMARNFDCGYATRCPMRIRPPSIIDFGIDTSGVVTSPRERFSGACAFVVYRAAFRNSSLRESMRSWSTSLRWNLSCTYTRLPPNFPDLGAAFGQTKPRRLIQFGESILSIISTVITL